MDQPDEIRQRLAEIFQQFQRPGDGIADTCRRVAVELNLQMTPHCNWQWEYIHQVMRGKLPPSSRLSQAIQRLYHQKNHQVEYEVVEVIAPPGFVTKYSLVCARAKKCLAPGCAHFFIPASPAQQFCSKQCKKIARRYRKELVHA